MFKRTVCTPTSFKGTLRKLSEAIQDVEAVLEAMRSEHDPLASHIFVVRRQYRNMPDTKSGKRGETAARLSWQTACNLGFRGSLEEMGTSNGCAAAPVIPGQQ